MRSRASRTCPSCHALHRAGTEPCVHLAHQECILGASWAHHHAPHACPFRRLRSNLSMPYTGLGQNYHHLFLHSASQLSGWAPAITITSLCQHPLSPGRHSPLLIWVSNSHLPSSSSSSSLLLPFLSASLSPDPPPTTSLELGTTACIVTLRVVRLHAFVASISGCLPADHFGTLIIDCPTTRKVTVSYQLIEIEVYSQFCGLIFLLVSNHQCLPLPWINMFYQWHHCTLLSLFYCCCTPTYISTTSVSATNAPACDETHLAGWGAWCGPMSGVAQLHPVYILVSTHSHYQLPFCPNPRTSHTLAPES